MVVATDAEVDGAPALESVAVVFDDDGVAAANDVVDDDD